MKLRIKPLLGGIATHFIPSLAGAMSRRNQPQVRADYYYTVWMRHVCTAHHFGCWNSPESVLEIGPGKAFGTGVAALISGVGKYYAYEANPPLNDAADQQLLHEMEKLFRRKEDFAENDPLLPSTAFPHHLFSAERIEQFLSNGWEERINRSLQKQDDLICYLSDAALMSENSVDYIFSHSVLEHVEDLPEMYSLMWRWLKPGGIMTHSIDFSSHGISHIWNGHWTIPDWVWRVMKGRRLYFLNREPASVHQRLLVQSGFEIVGMHLKQRESSIQRNDLSKRFQHLSESDLNTSSAFIVTRKPTS